MSDVPEATTESPPCTLPGFTDPADGRLHLICVRPAGPFEAFDAHLTAVASWRVPLLRVTILHPGDLPTPATLGFVSATVPTVLLVRAGEIIARSVGDLPLWELERLVNRSGARAPVAG